MQPKFNKIIRQLPRKQHKYQQLSKKETNKYTRTNKQKQ